MDRLQEIEARKLELRELLEDETKEVNLEEVKTEIDSLEAEEKEIKATEEAEKSAEERREVAKKLETRNVSGIKEIKENVKMEERKFTIADKEYRSAWAKSLMGLKEERFTEEEKRALGDAVTTTATEFVASAEGVQGINNGGLFIPTSVRNEFMEILTQQSPIFRDVRKLQVAGNIDLPYLFSSDDAEWYAELEDTKNEGQEYRSLQLTGFELAKNVVITWKLEEMAVDSFISFILDELVNKMGKALINAVIYGDGQGKPTGVTNGLTKVTDGETPIDTILATYAALDDDARVGAKAYISTNVNMAIVGYKDGNKNYPFLQGVATNSLVNIEQDPFLRENDIVVGNMRNYILNEVTPIRVDKEASVKGRKVTYGGYAIYDGKAKPSAFAYGSFTVKDSAGDDSAGDDSSEEETI